MSVFTINKYVDFSIDYYTRVPELWRIPRIYNADVEKLKEKIQDYQKDYLGGRIVPAMFNFPGRKPDFSMVLIPWSSKNPNVLLDNDGQWAVIACPLGIVKKNGKPVITKGPRALFKSLYKKEPDFAENVKNMIRQFKDYKDLGNLLELASSQPMSRTSRLLPSRTSLTQEFIKKGLEPPSPEMLNEIFGSDAITSSKPNKKRII